MKKILAELKNKKRVDLIEAILKVMAGSPEPPKSLDKLEKQKDGKNKHGKLNNFVGRKNEFDDLNSSNKEYREKPEKMVEDIKTSVETASSEMPTLKPGDYVMQKRKDATTYGYVIEPLKGKGFKGIIIDDDRKKAVTKTISDMGSIPVKIKESDVPPKLLSKIKKKLA